MNEAGSKRSFQTGNIHGRGFNVTGEKYDPIRKALLASLPRGAEGITFADLFRRVTARVKKQKALFPRLGSVMWYAKVVQLDLEKRGLIERVPGAAPMRLRRKK